MHIVIVGNGAAGMEAAIAVRRRQPDWEMTVVSEESDHFFSRTALMYIFSGQLSHRDTEPLERGLYERLRLKRVRARAIGLDTEARALRLAGGLPALRYDRLLIACGSRPVAPPPPWTNGDLRGIGHFVTHQDLDWIMREVYGPSSHERAPNADAHLSRTSDDSPYRHREDAASVRGRPAKSAAVIGGGLIGIEVCESLLSAGVAPHFIVREEWFWPMAINSPESTWIAQRLEEHGVRVHLKHAVQGFEGDASGNVERVLTDQGPIDADLVAITIGVRPNTDWLEGSAVERDRFGGVVVDDGLGSSVPEVFAAGDCASVVWFNDVRRPEQLWYTARDQGRVAGRRLLGDGATYRRGTFYNSAKLMDIEYTTAGLVDFGLEGHWSWFFEEQGRVRSTTRVCVKDDVVMGFNMLGRRWDHTTLVRWVEERRPIGWVLSHIVEASFDTEFVPRLRIPAQLVSAPESAKL